ncbi:MAG: hypothetical protein ICV78_29135 [Tolypothrix sp. Co-bin9]|nr:hypothetical protein [Tolypothrix sp. Co-bin9]
MKAEAATECAKHGNVLAEAAARKAEAATECAKHGNVLAEAATECAKHGNALAEAAARKAEAATGMLPSAPFDSLRLPSAPFGSLSEAEGSIVVMVKQNDALSVASRREESQGKGVEPCLSV